MCQGCNIGTLAFSAENGASLTRELEDIDRWSETHDVADCAQVVGLSIGSARLRTACIFVGCCMFAIVVVERLIGYAGADCSEPRSRGCKSKGDDGNNAGRNRQAAKTS